jgi:hypothetical protein
MASFFVLFYSIDNVIANSESTACQIDVEIWDRLYNRYVHKIPMGAVSIKAMSLSRIGCYHGSVWFRFRRIQLIQNLLNSLLTEFHVDCRALTFIIVSLTFIIVSSMSLMPTAAVLPDVGILRCYFKVQQHGSRWGEQRPRGRQCFARK